MKITFKSTKFYILTEYIFERLTLREWSAIILAGGKGKRLMPLTSLIPKPLVKVTNVPMIDYSIAHLVYADIKHIVIALAYKGELLKDYLKKRWTPDRLGDVELEYEIQDSKGTADAYRLLIDHVDSNNVAVSMGDLVTNLPMKEFMTFHSEKGGLATISMKTAESNISQYGVVLLDKTVKFTSS
ncbi:unnamed protein product [marine sediment metagenome]|uniref:Nucleotidyl transferase domain-containing protein n=1 Tax=marine sediment metagenome TaxID=412755 RepID=X1D617_9ZZZZ